jgi:uncharacterized protein (DUF488 family)
VRRNDEHQTEIRYHAFQIRFPYLSEGGLTGLRNLPTTPGTVRRVTSPGIVSCGYQSRTAESLIEFLLEHRVDVLADVRLTPMSRTRGLTKRLLAQHLADAGIEYRHFPSLGNPKENRAGFAKGDPAADECYRSVIDHPRALRDLDELALMASVSVVAVMCFEFSQEHCHRRVIVEELALRKVVVLPSA